MDELMTQLGSWDVDQLRVLNHEVCALIRHKAAHDAIAASRIFKVGDKVSFSPANRPNWQVGVILKMNRVKAIVGVSVTDMRGKSMGTMGRWNVPYSMMTKVK